MTDRLAEIRARAESIEQALTRDGRLNWGDAMWLLVSVKRLHAELEQVRQGGEAGACYAAGERQRLLAEVERLRAALRNRTATCVELAGQLEAARHG